MCKVAILFGGQSSEHPVSLMSARSVCENMPEQYQLYLVGITKDGKWYHYQGSYQDIENGNWQNYQDNQEVILSCNRNHHGFYNLSTNSIDYIDVIFPVLHGRFGEDGTIQGVCQLSGIDCVSDSMQSCVLAMDKELTHILCQKEGIDMAKYICVKKQDKIDYQKLFERIKNELSLPCYVKPAREGSSFGAHKISDYQQFITYSEDAFSYDNKILYEEFIDGTEVGCAILNNEVAKEMFEVIVSTEMYGYKEKYDGFKTQICVPAVNLSEQQQQQAKQLSLKIAGILGCNVIARVDFFNSSKGLIFNEANLIPGFTSHSLYPAMFRESNVSYGQLLDSLIKLVHRG